MTDEELLVALRKLDLPERRVNSLDVHWLLRNASINNVVPDEVREELVRRAREGRTFAFRVDRVLHSPDGTQHIDLMLIHESPHGCVRQYLCRKEMEGKYYYASVTWDSAAGQMSCGHWLSSGHTFGAVTYVAKWREA